MTANQDKGKSTTTSREKEGTEAEKGEGTATPQVHQMTNQKQRGADSITFRQINTVSLFVDLLLSHNNTT